MPEFVADTEDSDLSDLEDWASLQPEEEGEGEGSSVLESESEEEERVVLGKRRTRKPVLEIEYETVEPRSKLKASV